MTIERFNPKDTIGATPDGPWVRYADHAAEVERLREEYLNASSDAMKFAARIAELEKALLEISTYPMGSGRCTDDGYPSEITYDEYAYRRLVDSYRSAARTALKEPKP